jgi:hypothetical protein
MSIITLIIIIAAIVSIIGWICLFRDKDAIAVICFTLSLGTCIGVFPYMSDCDTKDKPTALDVYRGKTTLEITYRDSVAIDSTVVYKVK